MVWALITPEVLTVLLIVLMAEASNGLTDAPVGTSAAVASGVLSSRQALWVTAIGNFVGLIAALLVGAAVAKTIGTGIVRPSVITIESIGVAMATSIAWALTAWWLGLPVSKTHSLLAALAGIGYAQGGFEALLPESGNLADSGWWAVAKGVFFALIGGSAVSYFLALAILKTRLDQRLPDHYWRRFQTVTVCLVASGHGFNDGLKYVGIFTLVLYKAGIVAEFHVLPEVIILCAFVMAAATLLGGWRIHRRLNHMVNHGEENERGKKHFKPYMGVCAELSSAFFIWQTGWFGMPTSTNHATVAGMAGAKSADGRVHISSLVKIVWGWAITYFFCASVAYFLTGLVQ